ncbi:MAG: PIG-L family deacetylase [Bacteroidales bacterium]|nr:PIG-L family deacetylase [Bacteroidales bacterium]
MKRLKKAAAVLDAEYFTLGGIDGFLYDTKEMRLKVISLIRQVKAGVIFTHLSTDYHSDHRTTANIVEAAAMVSSLDTVPVKEKPVEITPLLYHTSPLTLSDPLGSQIVPPHFFVDVTSVIETKKKMLGYHISQIDLMKHMHKMDDFFGFVLEGTETMAKWRVLNMPRFTGSILEEAFRRKNRFRMIFQNFLSINRNSYELKRGKV